jgi:hypothetical protein
MSRRQTHLVRRGAIYYHRISVPSALIKAIGRREVLQSLRTSDLSTAKTRAALSEARTRLWFDACKARVMMADDDDLEDVRKLHGEMRDLHRALSQVGRASIRANQT